MWLLSQPHPLVQRWSSLAPENKMAAISLHSAGFFLDSPDTFSIHPQREAKPCKCLRCYFDFMQIQMSHSPLKCEARGKHLDLPDVPMCLKNLLIVIILRICQSLTVIL